MAEARFIFAIFLFFLAATVYLFYRWLTAPRERKPALIIPEQKLWYSPFFTNPFTRAKIKALHQHHQQKQKEIEHESVLTAFGGKKEIVSADFKKLHHLITQELARKRLTSLTQEEQDAFKTLQQLVRKSTSKRIVRIHQQEREQAIQALKRISSLN